MPHEVMEDVPHYPLKCPWCIAQSKGHPSEGIGPPISNKGGVDLVAELDVGLMVFCHPIQECIHHMSCYMVQNDISKGQRVIVLLRGLIQLPVVLADPDLSYPICSHLLRCNHNG